MNWIKNVALAVLSCMFFLILFEVVLSFLPVSSVTRIKPLSSVDDAFAVSSTPNAVLSFSKEWSFQNVQYRKTNNLGFFSDYDYVNTDPILAIGDSYVEAVQVPFPKTFHQVLADAIKHEIYNIGISGAPLSQYEAYLSEACRRFTPRKVIFTIVGNDFDESLYESRKRNGFFHYRNGELTPTPYEIGFLRRVANQSSLIKYVYFNLNLAGMFRPLIPDVGAGESNGAKQSRTSNSTMAPQAPDAVIESTGRFLTGVGTYCVKNDDIILAVDANRPAVYSGGRTSKAFEYFIGEALKQGFNVVNLHEIFAADYSKNKTRFEFPLEGHWNQYAHDLVARSLVKYFQ